MGLIPVQKRERERSIMLKTMTAYFTAVREQVLFQKEMSETFIICPDQQLSELATRLAGGRPMQVIYVDHGVCPMVSNVGLIVIPRRDKERFNRRQIEAVIHHEVYHFVSGVYKGEAIEMECDGFAAAAGYARELAEVLEVFMDSCPLGLKLNRRRVALLKSAL